MTADRDYFAGCHNVPLFGGEDRPLREQYVMDGIADAAACREAFVADGELLPNSSPMPLASDVVEWPTLADVVRAIDARRIVAQLSLPSELMPRADGELFG